MLILQQNVEESKGQFVLSASTCKKQTENSKSNYRTRSRGCSIKYLRMLLQRIKRYYTFDQSSEATFSAVQETSQSVG